MIRRLLLLVLAFVGIGQLARQRDATDDLTAGEVSEERESAAFRRGLLAGLPAFRDIGWAAALLVLGAGALGIVVLISGVVPIKASSGHWAITKWFLNFASSRSVATHSLGIKAPDNLDDPAMVLRGAGHYETACRGCHGTTTGTVPVLASSMTPAPPYLRDFIPIWEPRELFYIVKHGVKFTAMPAWPAQHRDDEVWAMVAFIRRLPEMDETQYRRLVRGDDAEHPALVHMPSEDLATPREVLDTCARCHGESGLGRGNAAFPKIGGQREAYLANALRAYKTGARPSGIMRPIAAALSDDVIAALARYYSGLAATDAAAATVDEASRLRGERIATGGDPELRVPACLQCHDSSAANPAYPRLSGQHAEFLEQQLRLFREGHRGGSPYAEIMRKVAAELTDEQVKDAARYFASRPPESRNRQP